MEIQRVILNNIGLFEKLEISLAPTEQNPSNITVFVGNNGAGKVGLLLVYLQKKGVVTLFLKMPYLILLMLAALKSKSWIPPNH